MNFSGQLNVEDFIDAAEEMDEFQIHYDREATYSTLTFDGFYETITVTADSLKYEFLKAETPREMAFQIQSASAVLIGMSEIQKLLPL